MIAVTGDCRDEDCARMIHIFHCLCASLNVRVWVEYVASGANLADLPSRDDFSLLLSMGSRAVPPSEVRFLDLSVSLVDALAQIESEFLPAPSASTKRHARRASRASR